VGIRPLHPEPCRILQAIESTDVVIDVVGWFG
jgi:hypothetical protein